MSKILLELNELLQIMKSLEPFPDAHYCEISVESISGIGKVTELYIPTNINNIKGEFKVTITDETDW